MDINIYDKILMESTVPGTLEGISNCQTLNDLYEEMEYRLDCAVYHPREFDTCRSDLLNLCVIVRTMMEGSKPSSDPKILAENLFDKLVIVETKLAKQPLLFDGAVGKL